MKGKPFLEKRKNFRRRSRTHRRAGKRYFQRLGSHQARKLPILDWEGEPIFSGGLNVIPVKSRGLLREGGILGY